MFNKGIRIAVLYFGFFVLLAGIAGCGPQQGIGGADSAVNNAQAVTSMKQIIEEGLSPVTVSALSITSP